MRITLSAAISADGYLDDSSPERLIISSPEDWEAIYALRAGCDAILVGAGTLRTDNPSLVIRDEKLRSQRAAQGKNPDIMKVAVSGSGILDARLKFFTEGSGEKLLFTSGEVSNEVSELATVISRPKLTASVILNYLKKIGVEKLLVEGGSVILSMFLKEKSWDEFRLAVGPFFVADALAPSVVTAGQYPRMNLDRVEKFGQTGVLWFTNESQYRKDCTYMARALALSRESMPCDSCYRVGAVVVAMSGGAYEGYTHETSPRAHAEQEAIAKALAAGEDLRGATIYSTMEPCSKRASKQPSCASLIIHNGFGRAVFALREPDLFVRCDGIRMLQEAGIDVVEMPAFSPEVRKINKHILE